MPVAEVQGFVQHHLSPTNSSGISQAPSDVEAEVDSDSDSASTSAVAE